MKGNSRKIDKDVHRD